MVSSSNSKKTTIKVSVTYHRLLKQLSEIEKRSVSKEVEYLIERRAKELGLIAETPLPR